MRTLRSTASILLLALLSTGIAHAEHQFGVGVKAGTLGLGLEASWQRLTYLELRIGAMAFDYNDDGDVAGIDYEQELSLQSFYATANIHFTDSPMRVTAGYYSNGNELLLTNDQMVDQEIGGVIFPGAGIGTLSSTTTFANGAPYFGIGYDFMIKGKIGMNVDFGVLWQGDPEVTLTADGALSGDPGFQAALEAERQELEEDLSDFKALPVLQIGFVYRF
jgi:hypothetical protein